MSEHSVLLPKWFTHAWGITLTKGQNGHSYTLYSLIYVYLNILAQSQILVISLYISTYNFDNWSKMERNTKLMKATDKKRNNELLQKSSQKSISFPPISISLKKSLSEVFSRILTQKNVFEHQKWFLMIPNMLLFSGQRLT